MTSLIQDDVTVRVHGGREYVIPRNGRVLGKGGYAEVRVATDLTTGMSVAAKIVLLRPLGRTDEATVLREARIMRQASSQPHPHVLALLDVHVARGADDPADLTRHHGDCGTAYLFVELCDGGELFDRLTDFGRVPEAHARRFMLPLLAGVRHLHRRGVIHRDLKLENVLLDRDGVLKIADFGLAALLDVDEAGNATNRYAPLRDVVGSKSYAAPEVLMRRAVGYSGPPADAWSCGVCLFTLLSGFFPLDCADTRDHRFRRLVQYQAGAQDRGEEVDTCATVFSWYGRECPFSEEAKALINGLLRVDPARRLGIDAAQAHAWFSCEEGEEPDGDSARDDGGFVTRGVGDAVGGHAGPDLTADMPVPLRQTGQEQSLLPEGLEGEGEGGEADP